MPARLGSDELNALIEISRTVNAHLDLDTVLTSVMAVTAESMDVEASSLILIDEDTEELLFHTATGEKAGRLNRTRLAKGTGLVGAVIEQARSEIVNDVTKDPRFSGKVDSNTGFTTLTVLCVPLQTKKRLWGAIEVLNKASGQPFDDRDRKFCEAIASQAAIAIENAVLHQRMVSAERLAAIGQTIAGMAHCIKNVLSGVRGGAYMVDAGLRKGDPDCLVQGWEIVKKNNVFLEDLVLDMLQYSKDRAPEYADVDMDAYLTEVLELVSGTASEKGVNVSKRQPGRVDTVRFDPNGIRRCLLNLMGNAIDAAAEKEDGHVYLEASPGNDGFFTIAVTDNGCGIPEENRKKLFQVFFSTKGSKGTGLGLAVTHKIVSEHQGNITVESTPGKGTTFAIRLPTNNK